MQKRKNRVEQYLQVRIDMLCEERLKNNNEVAHMVIDKCVGELSYVLEFMQRLNEENRSNTTK